MKCVLDPNVIVAALISRRGTPAQLLRLWRDGEFELVASPLLLTELRRVLAYPKLEKHVSRPQASEFLVLLTKQAVITEDPSKPPSLRTADPDDDYLIALAEATRAVIVSGDKHLLQLAGKLPICSPAEFLQVLGLT